MTRAACIGTLLILTFAAMPGAALAGGYIRFGPHVVAPGYDHHRHFAPPAWRGHHDRYRLYSRLYPHRLPWHAYGLRSRYGGHIVWSRYYGHMPRHDGYVVWSRRDGRLGHTWIAHPYDRYCGH